MPSPTFNLLYRYHGRDPITVAHLDLYRLDDPDDVWELGWAELGRGPEFVLIEWPERAEALFASDRWDVVLELTGDPGLRRVTAIAVGRPPSLPDPAAWS